MTDRPTLTISDDGRGDIPNASTVALARLVCEHVTTGHDTPTQRDIHRAQGFRCMTDRLVFGRVDPARYVVPEGECMACRHPARDHDFGPELPEDDGCPRCSCQRVWCYVHGALDEEHDCDAEGEL